MIVSLDVLPTEVTPVSFSRSFTLRSEAVEMADDLQQKLEGLQDLQRRQTGCVHRDFEWTLVANRVANGALQVWRRCDGCGSNRLGPGKWVPHEYLAKKGVELASIPVVNDEVRRRPPCRVCGARGTELHHWAPKAIFGDHADLWPTDYLCRPCHNRWHLAIAQGPAQQALDIGVLPTVPTKKPQRRPRRATA